MGLLVCAANPWRARAILPMVVAVVAVITISMAFDVRREAVALVTELPHLAEYAGLVLLWLLARNFPRSDDMRGGSLDDPGPGRDATVRILESASG